MLADLKYAFRSLLNSPGFTLTAVVTLALGIGATVAIFSVVNTVLLRPLPYAEPDQLARVYTEAPNFPNGGLRRFRASTTEYYELRRALQSWQSLDAWVTGGANLATTVEPTRVTNTAVTGGLLSTLGVAPALGRLLAPQDDVPGAPLVAVISNRLWRTAFGGDRAVVGRDILLNGAKYAVVGVMPAEFGFPVGEADVSDLWVPLQIDPAIPISDHGLFVIGRLKRGVALAQAQAELDAFVVRDGQESAAPHHFDPKSHTLVTYALHDEVVRGVRPALQMLFGAVGFLLLIACVNVANLLLSRAEGRQREIATRSALGAGVRRLARQFATEGVLLSAVGATLGMALAQGGLRVIQLAGAAGIPQVLDARIDARVLLFAVAMSLLTGLLFGVAPLAHVVKRNLHGVIKSAAASTTNTARAQGFRQLLIVGQLALALILLTGTGLMLRTFWNLQQVDAGFDSRGVLTMAVSLPESTYDGEAARSFWARFAERLAALPGVESAAVTGALPPIAQDLGWGTRIEGYAPVDGGPIASQVLGTERIPMVDHYQVIDPSYFDALRIRVVAGRSFDARDDASAPKALIVNQTLARAIWGNESAIGRRILPAVSTDEWYTVVGVVADVKNGGVDAPTGTALYLPYAQVPSFMSMLRRPYIVVRSATAPSSIISAVRRELRDIDPTLPLAQVRTLDEVVSGSQSRPRFFTLMLTLFAGVSLALAAVGVYGVIAYSVAQRTREFGIRMALGAQPRKVLSSVLTRGLVLTAGGILVGLVGAFALTRFLSGFLFGVAATDLPTFAGVALMLGAVAMLASYLAARRATKVDPLVALRAE